MGAKFSISSPAAGPSEPSRVTAIHSAEIFKSFNDSSKLVVVDFSAAWCGPCRFMEPVFDEMANKYLDVQFIKIDVDELADLAKEFEVQAMPTLVLLKQGKEVGRVVGAQKDELEQKIIHARGTS